MKPHYLFTLVALFSAAQARYACLAQPITSRKEASLEFGTFLATRPTNPFWIRSNQFGEIPLESPGLSVRAQLHRDYRSQKDSKLTYGYGLRGVANAGRTNQLLLSEAYGRVQYGAVELYAGRRRQVIGLADTTLGAGSYIGSGNALPLPMVQFSIPDYTYPFRNGWVAVKGSLGHGWFGRGNFVRDYYLHQKSLYLRLGKPDWRFKVHGGLNHQVQWGGTLQYTRVDRGVTITRFGSDWTSYWYAFSGRSLYISEFNIEDGQATAEGGNRIGNHLGTIDLGIEYEGTHNRWLLYRQSIYDDGSLYYLNNIADGLLGLSLTRKNRSQGFQKLVIEYLHTASQGGPISSGAATDEALRGRDNYFNNGRYLDGWVYRGQTIGTPFLMPLRYTTALPQNLAPHPERIVNNRVNAVILGVQNTFRRVQSVTRLSVSNNLGHYDHPLRLTQVSVQQQITLPIRSYQVSAVLAYDQAGVLQDNLGLALFVKRAF